MPADLLERPVTGASDQELQQLVDARISDLLGLEATDLEEFDPEYDEVVAGTTVVLSIVRATAYTMC